MSIIAGVIAAGDGSRLAHSYPDRVKPMVPLAGKPLSHWVVGSLFEAGARSITVLVNSRGHEVPGSLTAQFPQVQFSFLTENTASSFESFRLVSKRLAQNNNAFLISTVDAIISPSDIQRFWQECLKSGTSAGLALTTHVDDEKPLWVDIDNHGYVSAIGEKSKQKKYVTAGLYYLTQEVVLQIPQATTHSRLRDFWMALREKNVPVYAPVLSKTFDIDRPEDITAVEEFLLS